MLQINYSGSQFNYSELMALKFYLCSDNFYADIPHSKPCSDIGTISSISLANVPRWDFLNASLAEILNKMQALIEALILEGFPGETKESQ